MHPKARVVFPRLPLLLPARIAGVPVRRTGEVHRGLKAAIDVGNPVSERIDSQELECS